jgi:hypothetical protein
MNVVQFRCWYCNKRYAVAEARVGEKLTCSCQRRLRVPRRTGGNCRHKTPVDWVVEWTVYGGGGALLGFGLALLILSKVPYRGGLLPGRRLILACTALGFLLGALLGEAGVNWVGRLIRRFH